MKLCEKCIVSAMKAGFRPEMWPGAIIGQQGYSLTPAPDAECEFWAHKEFNRIIELVKYCLKCGTPTHSFATECVNCGSRKEWSGLPLART